MNERDFSYISVEDADQVDEYVQFSAPPKLLGDLLKGPRYAHWNNASIGSHLRIRREPNCYERGMYYSMNFFHA